MPKRSGGFNTRMPSPHEPTNESTGSTDSLERVSLFFGAAIVGSVLGGWAHYFAGGRVPAFVWNPPGPLSLLFVVVGVGVSVRARGLLFRSAWAVFVVHHLLTAASAFGVFPLPRALSDGLILLFAVLLIWASGRAETGRVIFLATTVFLAATAFRMVTLEYADRVLGRRSVVTVLDDRCCLDRLTNVCSGVGQCEREPPRLKRRRQSDRSPL